MPFVSIPYKSRVWAKKFHASQKRFFSLIIHRRGGKTTGIINHMQRYAMDNEWEKARLRYLMPSITEDDMKQLMRGRFYGIVYPTYSQAELVAWEMLKYYSSFVPNVKTNEVDLEVRYPNGNRIRLFGADKPDRLRGPAFWGLAFDEYSQQPPSIFSEVLSKSLADHLGFAIFAGTIKGKNQLYRTHEIAKANPQDWDYIWQDIDESLKMEEGITVNVLRQSLEDDRKLVKQGMITEEEFLQEWYLSAAASAKGAIYARELTDMRRSGRVTKVPYDKSLKVYTVWDLGKGANMAVGFYQSIFGQMKMIDFWEGSNDDGLPEAIREVLRKPYIYGKHFAPHDINAVDISTGVTRKVTAKKLGIKFHDVPDVSVEEGINAAKLMFNRLWIDEIKCGVWLDCVSMYRRQWDEKKGMFRDRPLHDYTSHSADVGRYAALAEPYMIDDDSVIINTYEKPLRSFDPY